MRREHWALLGVLFLIVAVITADVLLVSKFKARFEEIEKQRIITSNKLATAKIISENLNHVRDLVFKNMDVPGSKPNLAQETSFFSFVTTCVNDLKLKLISVKPVPPTTNGRITTYTYDIQIEGDFFKFGELCAKFENSRRIVSVERYDVTLAQEAANIPQRSKGQMAAPAYPSSGTMPAGRIAVTMRVNTYWVK